MTLFHKEQGALRIVRNILFCKVCKLFMDDGLANAQMGHAYNKIGFSMEV